MQGELKHVEAGRVLEAYGADPTLEGGRGAAAAEVQIGLVAVAHESEEAVQKPEDKKG